MRKKRWLTAGMAVIAAAAVIMAATSYNEIRKKLNMQCENQKTMLVAGYELQTENTEKEKDVESDKEHIVRPVRAILQIPGHFADYCKSEQLQEVLHPVSGMPEALCNEEGKHRKSDATEAAHDLIKKCTVLHQVVGTVVCHHGKDGDDLQCATT